MRPKTIIAIVGLPTTGKSSLGRELAVATGIRFIDIDEGPASCTLLQEPDPYRSDETRARERARMTVAYIVLHAAVEANLAEDFSVIVSATYSRHRNQDFLKAAVERGGGTLKIIWCQYRDTPEEIERRINDRVARGVTGGCRSVSHYFDDKKRYEGIALPHIVVAMEGGDEGLTCALSQALTYINEE